jgi:uncharacterized membrane protein YeaQ/YmgE (transglycosylase-associated protein family)
LVRLPPGTALFIASSKKPILHLLMSRQQFAMPSRDCFRQRLYCILRQADNNIETAKISFDATLRYDSSGLRKEFTHLPSPEDKDPDRRPGKGEETVMSWIAWIILGLIAGFIGSKIVNRSGSGVLIDIVIGIVGALIGGYISTNLLGGPPVTGINFTSLLIAIAGSIILLVIYNAVARRS